MQTKWRNDQKLFLKNVEKQTIREKKSMNPILHIYYSAELRNRWCHSLETTIKFSVVYSIQHAASSQHNFTHHKEICYQPGIFNNRKWILL